MKYLKEQSIKIDSNTVVCWPQFQMESRIDVNGLRSKFNGAYSVNNSTICFVHDSEVYVTPYTRKALETLDRAGFKMGEFYVPFSSWDYPKYQEEKWDQLRKAARLAKDIDYENDCRKWCSEHGIKELDEAILNNCFRMPITGVPVEHIYFKNTYYPVCGETCIDCTVVDKLGKYCANNGKVVFVYTDGHTYVAKGYGILKDLEKAGFEEAGLFVPFSNGELITDKVLAAKWNMVPKRK